MNDDPIRKEKTIFEKLIDIGKKIFKKKPKEENYFVSPYEIEKQIKLNKLENDIYKLNEAISRGGMSFNEARAAFLDFGNSIKKI